MRFVRFILRDIKWKPLPSSFICGGGCILRQAPMVLRAGHNLAPCILPCPAPPFKIKLDMEKEEQHDVTFIRLPELVEPGGCRMPGLRKEDHSGGGRNRDVAILSALFR